MSAVEPLLISISELDIVAGSFTFTELLDDPASKLVGSEDLALKLPP
jgi:hypothetical protein